MGDQRYVTEIPSSLKQLARFVVRGFYSIEDALVVDMLVRNPCMKEDDICELLKFERKITRRLYRRLGTETKTPTISCRCCCSMRNKVR